MRCTFTKYSSAFPAKLQNKALKTAVRLTTIWEKNTGLKTSWGLFVNNFFRKAGSSSSYKNMIPYLHLSSERFLLQRSNVVWDISSASAFSPGLKVVGRCLHRNAETPLKYRSYSICRTESWNYFNNFLQRLLVSHSQVTSNFLKLANNKDI